jgi:hypothetical protein
VSNQDKITTFDTLNEKVDQLNRLISSSLGQTYSLESALFGLSVVTASVSLNSSTANNSVDSLAYKLDQMLKEADRLYSELIKINQKTGNQ